MIQVRCLIVITALIDVLTGSLDPSLASVADRLRKQASPIEPALQSSLTWSMQIKTHAVKVLREAIGDKACTLTTAMLRGYRFHECLYTFVLSSRCSGPMAPAKIIEPLVQQRATLVTLSAAQMEEVTCRFTGAWASSQAIHNLACEEQECER